MTDDPSAKRKISDMNQITENQNISGSVDPLAQEVFNALRKSGTKVWLGLPPSEEMAKLKEEKAEHDFQLMKRRADARDREHETLKQLARDVIRQNRGEQV
jgi:hypothetical protein